MMKVSFLLCLISGIYLVGSAQSNVRFIPYRKGTVWGYADTAKHITVPLRYAQAFPFYDNHRAIVKYRKHYHLMDTLGVLSADSFESFGTFSEGLLQVVQQGKVGYMDSTGKIVIPPRYEAAEPFSEGRAVVFTGGKAGIIDHSGAYVVQPKYSATSKVYSSGLLLVSEGVHSFFINRKGVPLQLNPSLLPSGGFSEGLAPAYKRIVHKPKDTTYRLVYINPAGKVVLDSLFSHNSYSEFLPFTNGSAVLVVPYEIHKEYFFLDTGGKLSPPYNSVKSFSEGYSLAIDGYFASDNYIVDTGYHIHGKIIGRITQAGVFHNGLACIGRDSTDNGNILFGYVNPYGNTAIRFKYEYALDFDRGLAAVVFNGMWGYIDIKGREYWED